MTGRNFESKIFYCRAGNIHPYIVKCSFSDLEFADFVCIYDWLQFLAQGQQAGDNRKTCTEK